MKQIAIVLVCAGILGCASDEPHIVIPAATQESVAYVPAPATAPASQPDNTAVNRRDANAKLPTAGMQGQGKSDVQITANIRQAVVQRSMSMNAHNVKIITINGKVTLRGPVNSQYEKDTIGEIAASTAGLENVDNELEVKSK